MPDEKNQSALEGVCYFFSETGSEGGFWAFQDKRFIFSNGRWSYEGLHILENGDHLTIYSLDKPGGLVWAGTISLRSHPLFTEHASGLWIHADQNGMPREVWAAYFFNENPAKLVRTRKK